jgi:hypothetical protein
VATANAAPAAPADDRPDASLVLSAASNAVAAATAVADVGAVYLRRSKYRAMCFRQQ